MNAELTNGSVTPIKWYARTSVDDYLAAAAEKRTALEQQIAEAQARAERAHAAAGLHRLMAAMVLDTQREVVEVRRAAELQAIDIVTAAQRDATHAAVVPAAGPDTLDTGEVVIDLSADARVASEGHAIAPPAFSRGADDGGADSQFFAFLRDGLTDQNPLGPRAEDQEHA